jgi:hypothetical protein
MALPGIMIEPGRPAWWGHSTDHTDLPLHGDIFLTWNNAYWWGHDMTLHSHPCIIHGETCSDSIVDRCCTLNKNIFNSIFVKIFRNFPPDTQKGIGSILMSTICFCQSFWEFPNLGFEDVFDAPSSYHK